MSLHIAGGFGLGGAESYPGVFGPFAGFADDAQLETAISNCLTAPASASKDRQRSTASCATSSRSAAKGSLLRSRMQKTKPPTWKELLDREQPAAAACAHDRAVGPADRARGLHAYSIGGFALVGSRYGIPTSGCGVRRDQRSIRDIMAATSLPVMVDGDTGYGDVKNVAHTIEGYEAMGASAIFLEDQVARSAAATWPART